MSIALVALRIIHQIRLFYSKHFKSNLLTADNAMSFRCLEMSEMEKAMEYCFISVYFTYFVIEEPTPSRINDTVIKEEALRFDTRFMSLYV